MAITDLNTKVFSKELELKLRKSLVANNFVNRNYQGVVAGNESVDIIAPASITINNYDGSDITHQAIDASKLTMTIDQAKYFAMSIKDINQAKTTINLAEMYAEEANYTMSDTIDQNIFDYLATQALTGSNIVPTVVLTKTNIYPTLVEAKRLLSNSKVPLQGRRVALSPDEIALLEQSGELVRSTVDGDNVVRNGFVGKVAGFDVYETANLKTEVASAITTGDDVHRYAVFAHEISTTMAMAINNVEKHALEKNFGTGIKGLAVFGRKTTKLGALGVIKIKIGTGTA